MESATREYSSSAYRSLIRSSNTKIHVRIVVEVGSN